MIRAGTFPTRTVYAVEPIVEMRQSDVKSILSKILTYFGQLSDRDRTRFGQVAANTSHPQSVDNHPPPSEPPTRYYFSMSLPTEAHFATTAFRWSDMKGENRRFMFDGKRMLLGITKGSPTEGSHAVEWRDATGSNAGFDNAVRGWVGIGGRSKNGVIHFAPPIKSEHVEAFDKAFDALRWFESRGAGPKTTVRGFEGAWEQTLADVLVTAESLIESRLSQVEYDVARLKQSGDIEKVRSMLAAGIASTRVAKDMPRPSGSWAWFEVFDIRDGMSGERIPGVVFYAPLGLSASQFGSAAKKALQRSIGESEIVARIDSLLAVLS